MTKKFKIISIGECMVEMSRERNYGSFLAKNDPQPDRASQSAPAEACGREQNYWKQGFAGDSFNTAYYLKALLGERAEVNYVTCVGDDLYSAQMLDFIAKNGIGTNSIRKIAGKRLGLYLIHQQDGDRQFTYWRETSAARHLADDEDFLYQALEQADMVYFSGITLAILDLKKRENLLGIIKQSGAKLICFDPNIRLNLWPNRQELQQALKQAAQICNIVLPTYDDEAALMGDQSPLAMAQRYLELGAGEVVVKNGAANALVVNAQLQVTCAPPVVNNVIDATGAGDSFNAAYLAARLQGQEIEQALKAGHEVAAVVITHPGALIDKNVILLH